MACRRSPVRIRYPPPDFFMASFSRPLFHFGEYLVVSAFVFHALNGIRLVLAELGFTLGKPARPVYPYRISLDRGRPLFLVLMGIVVILLLLGGYDFFVVAH